MKKEIAEAWVADLRTNPPQTTGQLYDGEGHCCLGRLCLVLGATFVQGSNDGGLTHEFRPFLNGKTLLECGVLPKEIRKLAGMGSNNGLFPTGSPDDPTEELTGINDNGATFAEIADIIEKKWESL